MSCPRLSSSVFRAPFPYATHIVCFPCLSVQGYGQQRRLRNALLAFRRFLASGGRPHRKLCEYTYRLCLAHFDFAAAGQVLRAMRLMRGLPLREELYRQQWEEAQKRMQVRYPSAGGWVAGWRWSGGL